LERHQNDGGLTPSFSSQSIIELKVLTRRAEKETRELVTGDDRLMRNLRAGFPFEYRE